MRSFLTAFLFGLLFFSAVQSQEKKIIITKIYQPVAADGVLDEAFWQAIEPVSGFWMHYPADTLQALKQNVVKLAYDDQFLYIAAVCSDSREKPIIQSLSRDDENGFWSSDAFSVTIDPLNTQKSGYFFGLNAGGAEIDALVSQKGFQPKFDINWNTKWRSGVSVGAEGFCYEFQIPLSVFSMDPNNRTWGVNFLRNDMDGHNKFITWTHVPMIYDGRDLTYLGEMQYDSTLTKSKGRFVLLPGLSVKTDDENDEGKLASKFKYGLDAKITISPAVRMDVMIIPDFSDANVDKDYIDFERFEYFMNEQRSFFLENSDLFADYGDNDFRPVYTRRIGIYDWNYYPIWAGGRVTGKFNNGFDFGLLSIHTDTYEHLPTQNFSIAAARKTFGKLDLKVLGTNIESYERNEHLDSAYNRTISTALAYSAFQGKIDVYGGVNKSFAEASFKQNLYYNARLNVNTKHFRLYNSVNSVGDNYINQLGFFNKMFHKDDLHDTTYRHGLTEVMNKAQYWFYPEKSKLLNYFFPQLFHKSTFDTDGRMREFIFGGEVQANHKNSSYSTLFLFYDRINLRYPLEVFENYDLMPPGFYGFRTIGLFHKTDSRKVLFFELFTKYGGFYNGTRYQLWNAINIRLQPKVKIKLEYTLKNINLPGNYGSGAFHLLGLQTDVFFSRDLIWTNFFQYNTQSDRLRLNSKFQWRYSPMSSFYFVVSEAYQPEARLHEKLTLTAKLTYWLSH